MMTSLKASSLSFLKEKQTFQMVTPFLMHLNMIRKAKTAKKTFCLILIKLKRTEQLGHEQDVVSVAALEMLPVKWNGLTLHWVVVTHSTNSTAFSSSPPY